MSIPRVALMVAFGLISSSGPTDETVVNVAAASTTQAPARGRGLTVTVQIFVVPQEHRTKGQSAIQSWARGLSNVQPSDIIVDGKKVWMLIHNTLLDHEDHTNYHFELAAVHLSVSRGDQVRWELRGGKSLEIAIQKETKHKHQPQNAKAPDNPFPGVWPKVSEAWIESGPPVPGSVNQRYMAILTIDGVKYDPDIVCEP